ncbi:MAG: signal peptidase II [Steroidobacteraceae bacterium]
MSGMTRIGLIAVLLFACVGCDQVSKHVVRQHVAVGQVESYAGDTFRLTHARNPGAFLSLGADLPHGLRVAAFQGGVAAVVLGLLAWAAFARRVTLSSVVGLSLLAASGLGNLIDRLAFDGVVTDFLNLGFGAVRTGVFNLADVFGLVGVTLLVLGRERPAGAGVP